MQTDKICSFFGHRKIVITDILKKELETVIEKEILKGCNNFYFGGFGDFDELCHKLVSKLKEKYPNIRRIFCLSDPRHLREWKRPKWLKNEDYEEFVYLDLRFDWWYQRIYYRNCAIIDQSDVIIFYAEQINTSGAYKALKYALKKKKRVINLFSKL